MSEHTVVTLREPDGSMAVVAPELGGWLLRYARETPGAGLVDALHFSQAVVDRYPKEMYAGSPILFPLVSFNHLPDQENHYEWNGNVYSLPQHGFGRKSKWAVIDRTETSLTLELGNNVSTQAAYPFSFTHRLVYRLDHGKLRWEQTVENHGQEPMPFSSGFHPYFAAPLTPKGHRADCFVELPEAKRILTHDRAASFTSKPFPSQNWSVQEDVSGTMFLSALKKSAVTLVDPGSNLEVTLNFEEAPHYRFLALWSKSIEEPYYCIEPWTALPNSFTRKKDRELIVLEPGKSFRAAMWMELRVS